MQKDPSPPHPPPTPQRPPPPPPPPAAQDASEGWVPQAVAKRVSLCRVAHDWPEEGAGTLGPTKTHRSIGSGLLNDSKRAAAERNEKKKSLGFRVSTTWWSMGFYPLHNHHMRAEYQSAAKGAKEWTRLLRCPMGITRYKAVVCWLRSDCALDFG